jgi:hypothetical protein
MPVPTGRIERRIARVVTVEICPEDEGRPKERTLTENVSAYGARVLMERERRPGQRIMVMGRARHGFHRNPGVWRARAKRLQRVLRVHLLSPAVAVQSIGRLSGSQAAARQCAQRRRLRRGFVAGDRAAGDGKGSGVPSRRGLCEAGDL